MKYRLLLLNLFYCSQILAEQTGPNYAGTVGVSGTGDVWLNMANAQGSTVDNYASVSIVGGGNASEFITFTNFGINIPSGYKVDGITVEVRWRRSGSNTVEDNTVQLINNGVITGTNNGTDNAIPTTASIASYGGSTDTWGLSFNEAEIELSNFGVAIRLDKQGGGPASVALGEIDWVRVTVTSSFVISVGGADSDHQASVTGGTGNIGWTPLNNQVANSDDVYESVTLTKGQNSQYLIIDNWGISINPVNEILGISVTFERRANGDRVSDFRIFLVDETGAARTSGTNKANLGSDWPNGTDGSASYGGSTDVWGEAAGYWTPAKLNDPDFGIAIAVLYENAGPAGTRIASIDNVILTITYSVPLPVELTKFEGIYQNNSVVLNWQTATEINNDYFEVQRASASSDFTTIGQVAGNDNSKSTIDYAFVDPNPASGINYYRLKQVDFDGKFEYSPVVVIHTSTISSLTLSIYPNPVEEFIKFKTEVPLSASQLKVFDLNGTEMKVTITDSNWVQVSNLRKGVYILQLSTPVETFIQKFVKR